MKKIIHISIGTLIVLVGLLLAYLAYLSLTYYRQPNLKLTPYNQQDTQLTTNTPYRIATYNIGYASYNPEYSFFMDGGKYSVAFSQEDVLTNLHGIVSTLKNLKLDFACLQEIDQEATRSYYQNQIDYVTKKLPDFTYTYGQNYDSPYLFYPLKKPIGRAKSGLLTLSKGNIQQAKRIQLPIETGFNKFFDLDRAFTISDIPVQAGKTLSLINVHLSAFTKDKSVQAAQLKTLFRYMTSAYQQGNYVLVCGDYNHDVLGNSSEIFGKSTIPLTWTKPFPKQDLPQHFNLATQHLAQKKIPSVRNLNEAYQPGKTFVSLVDGFIISDNIQVDQLSVKQTNFNYSDHNPVVMGFQLLP